MDLFSAMKTRASKRAFLDRPVSREIIREILSSAAQAPSAINLQPWEFTVVAGDERPRLSRALARAYKERKIGCGTGSSQPLPDRIRARQLSSFTGLAELMQAEAAEVSSFINQGSLDFYGAPAAIIVTKEKFFPETAFTSVGLMIGWLLLAAEAKGLGTCPVGLINSYEDTVLDFLNLEDRDLMLGIALGYPDPEAPVNRLRTPRESVDELIHWYG